MYLKKSYNRKTGRTQLFIVEAYRDKDKKPKSKVIRTLGYLDVLEKQYDDPISYFTCMARQMTATRDKAFKSIELILNPAESMTEPAPKLNFGVLALTIAYADLNMEPFFSTLPQISRTEYRLNVMLRNAICISLLYPSYTERDFRNMTGVFKSMPPAMSDTYRASDLMRKHREPLLRFIYERLCRLPLLKDADAAGMEAAFNTFLEEMFDPDISCEDFFEFYKDDLETIRSSIDEELSEGLAQDFDRHRFFDIIMDTAKLMRFLGLALCYILADKLEGRYSVCEILRSIRKCEYIHVDNDVYMLEYSDELLSELGKAIGADFTKKFRRREEIQTLIRA